MYSFNEYFRKKKYSLPSSSGYSVSIQDSTESRARKITQNMDVIFLLPCCILFSYLSEIKKHCSLKKRKLNCGWITDY